MYILSFKDGHDPAACILKDGRIVAAAEEERFIRVKHAPSVFPEQSIRFCLAEAKITPGEIDHVVYARHKAFRSFLNVSAYYLTHLPRSRIMLSYALGHIAVQVKGVLQALQGRARYGKIYTLFPDLPRPLYSFDHHLSHAASAYYFSGFDDALVVTADGKGEATSVTIGKGLGTKLSIKERRGVFSSLGLFYSAVTKHLGFTPNDGEYKVMGLAPYGDPRSLFAGILDPDERHGYRIDPDFTLYPKAAASFRERFGAPRVKESPLTEDEKALAASAQDALECAALSLIRYAQKRYPSKRIALAGGVALNVKMNKLIWETGLFEDMFVQPAAGDDGLVFGAAALLYVEKTGKRPDPLGTLLLGPSYDDDEIKKALEDETLSYVRLEDVVPKTVDLLLSGNVIGWYQGRMEFGPRALGARSILAHPGYPNMKELINAKIKFREEFRPFCPSVLSEYAPKICEQYLHSPYMVMSFTMSEEYRSLAPAVLHVDNTIRPQAVIAEHNPLYHRLISEFNARGGLPLVLNTSLNIRGEPIVCTPKDAVDFFLKTNVDAMVIGNYVIERIAQSRDFNPLSIEALKTEY